MSGGESGALNSTTSAISGIIGGGSFTFLAIISIGISVVVALRSLNLLLGSYLGYDRRKKLVNLRLGVTVLCGSGNSCSSASENDGVLIWSELRGLPDKSSTIGKNFGSFISYLLEFLIPTQSLLYRYRSIVST